MSRILWIDDEPYYLEAHITTLKEAGYEVDVAEDEKTALEKLKYPPLPALIILDIIMPKDVDDPGPDNGMSTGIHLLRQLSNEIKTQVPIIVLTIIASQDAHDRVVEIGQGCKKLEVRVKPFLPSELLEEVNRLLE
jgi:putative two-component system response regulator